MARFRFAFAFGVTGGDLVMAFWALANATGFKDEPGIPSERARELAR